MSNFTGVTFAKQKVLPSDDAIIRRAILSDGILYGCELSYSGSTLTMGPGQMLICGRQARHPSVQNWAVVGATSGYARLVLTVDLSRTASKDYFDQIKDTVEYASAVDGFPELEQADVNVSGTRYQVVACVVSLGTGGITGFVSKLGPCEVAGGGGLNFRLVGGLTQPADPAENVIWVETDTAITSYAFSATEPAEPAQGMVWVAMGTSSTAAFNALKKNILMVYPISTKQYVGSVWEDRNSKIFQGGSWVEWIVYLYKNGTKNTSLVGELKTAAVSEDGSNTGLPIVTENTDNITIKMSSGGNTGGIAYFEKKIDLTPFRKLVFDGQMYAEWKWAGIGIWTEIGTTQGTNRAAAFLTGSNSQYPELTLNGKAEIDISQLTGEYYIGFTITGKTGSTYITVNELFLE